MSLKKIVFILTFFLLVGHFMLTFIYCLPGSIVGSRLASYSQYYSDPVFKQGWALFAPEPQKKGKTLMVKVFTFKDTSPWLTPADSVYGQHCSTRFGSASKEYHMAQNCAFYLWQELDKFTASGLSSAEYYPNTFGYSQACHFAEKWLYHKKTKAVIDSIQIRLVLTDALDSKQVDIYDFPTYLPEE